MNKKYYEYAVQLHNQEFRTLGERTNSALIVQTILMSSLILILVYEKSILGYILPYVVTGVVFIGALIMSLLHFSGKEGSKSAFTWLRYMRALERGERGKPWSWFDKHRNDFRKDRGVGNSGLTHKLLLPSSWIIIPSILLFVWSVASLYIPGRIIFDCSFAVDSGRIFALVISIINAICVWSFFITILYGIKLWWYKW